MKLTPRLTLIFTAYASALLLGVGLMAYNSGRDALRDATISELQATALEKEASLNRWVQDKQADIAALTTDPAIILAAYNLSKAEPELAGSPGCPCRTDREPQTSSYAK